MSRTVLPSGSSIIAMYAPKCVGGYTVAYAMLLITGARLGDLYGRRRMYLLGAIGFTVTSLACGFAPNALALIVFRFMQGAAAAVMVPQIMSVIQMRLTQSLVNMPLSKTVDASGLLTTIMQLGQVLGVAVFGTVFLSLEPQSAEHLSAHASAAALSTRRATGSRSWPSSV